MKILDLDSLLDDWKKEYGAEKRAKKNGNLYFKIEPGNRYELLMVLVQMIKDTGKEREYFTSHIKDRIVYGAIPPEGCIPRPSFLGYKNAAMQDLRMAIAAIYSEIERVEVPEIVVPVEPEKVTEFVKEFDPASIDDGDESPVHHQKDPDLAKLMGFEPEE